MNATIINFAAHHSHRRTVASLQDRVAQAVMETFQTWPITSVVVGIAKARAVLDQGGSFIESMEAAEQTIQRHTRLCMRECGNRTADRIATFKE